MPFPSPSDFLKMQADLASLSYQSNSVIAMRLLGFAGFWGGSPFEAWTMIAEKQDALFGATRRAAQATMRGERPHQVAQEAMKPFQDKTRANQVRLSKRGPKL